jgi:Domain of unknown function (DUF4271)
VTKLSILLLTCLFVFNTLEAQIDSTRPPAVAPVQVQDTGVAAVPRPPRDSAARARHDSVAHARRDSIAHARRDSVARVRHDSVARVRRDSIARVRVSDSTSAAGVTTAAPVTPSSAAATPPMAAPAAPAGSGLPAAAVRSGPPALDFWEKVLALNPFFNFTGKPVVEIFEVHHPNSKDSLFYLIVAILFYFALIRIFFEKYFNNLMTLFFRVSLRQQQIREQVLQTPLPSLLLNILFVISAGLYACYLFHYSPMGAGIPFWILYLNCMVLLGTIYLVKFLVLKFIGWVFSISRATDIYIFIVFLVNKMLGIFLLPFLIIITFSSAEMREIFITISLAMIFVLWSYRVLASYRPVRNEIKLTPFYFFLYLCAFEIAPLLLIYKVLLTYLEKVY